MTKILQKYSNVSFCNTVYSAHNENNIQNSDLDYVYWRSQCEWHFIFIAKSYHRIKEQPFIRAGFAIPQGTLLSGFHYSLRWQALAC